MALPDRYKPGRIHLPRHLHIARWVGITIAAPLALLGSVSTVLLWKLAHGPVDVTAVSRLIEPIPVVAGKVAGHPAGRLAWSRLRVQWQPSSGGISAGLMLEAQGLTVTRLDGSVAERAGEADTVLALEPLLRGVLAPRRLRLQNVSLFLRRQANGEIELDLPSQTHGHGRGVPTRMDRLAALDLHNVSVTLAGLPKGQTLFLGPVEAHGHRLRVAARSDDYLWNGWWRSAVRVGDVETVLSAKGGQVSAGRGVWQLSSTEFNPSGLGAVSPALARWNVPVKVETTVGVVPHGMAEQPSDVMLHLVSGAGRIAQAHETPLDVRAGEVRLGLAMGTPGWQGPGRLTVTDGTLALADAGGVVRHLKMSGEGVFDDLLHPRSVGCKAQASLDGFDFATAGSIWPEGVSKGARKWVVANITAGRGRGLAAQVELRSATGLRHLRPVSLKGTLLGDAMTVHWLRPVPAATNVRGVLGFDGFDTLTIRLLGGQQDTAAGRIDLSGGEVRIDELFEPVPSNGDIRLHLRGGIAAVESVLSHPRLNLLSRHPLSFTEVSGDMDTDFRLVLPLRDHVSEHDMHVEVKAAFEGVHLGNVLLGRALDGASGTLGATEAGLTITGAGRLDGVPLQAVVKENFRSGAANRVVQDIQADGVLDPASAVRAKLVPAGLFSGQAGVSAHYVQRADERADLDVSVDLGQAAVTLPVWGKAIGVPALASGHMALHGRDIVALDGLQAHGQDLSIAGHGEIGAGRLRSIVLDGFRLGRNEGRARIGLPEREVDPVRVGVEARVLDLTPVFDEKAREAARRAEAASEREAGVVATSSAVASGASSGTSSGQGWSLDAKASTVYFGPKGNVGGAVSHVELRGGRLRSGRFALESPTRVRAVLADTGRSQPFVADVSDLGALLQGLGLYDRIGGGMAHLDGTFMADRGGESGLGFGLPPFEGHLTIGPFEFLKPPFAMTAAFDLSPLQWGQGHLNRFAVQRVSTDVLVQGRRLMVRDGMMGNQALGATLEGPINLETAGLDLKGTIVPLFGLNALPGKLPKVGHLLTPEKGGGVLAMTFRVKGTVGVPDLRVNPLSMLLPGALRKILR